MVEVAGRCLGAVDSINRRDAYRTYVHLDSEGCSRRRTNSTARRRNSGGRAAGITDSSPEAIIASDRVSGLPGQAPPWRRCC